MIALVNRSFDVVRSHPCSHTEMVDREINKKKASLFICL